MYFCFRLGRSDGIILLYNRTFIVFQGGYPLMDHFHPRQSRGRLSTFTRPAGLIPIYAYPEMFHESSKRGMLSPKNDCTPSIIRGRLNHPRIKSPLK